MALHGQQNPMLNAMFAVPPKQLQRMAGDVVPLPVAPDPNAGPPAGGAGTVLDAYRSGIPNVRFLPPSLYEEHLKNINRRLIGGK